VKKKAIPAIVMLLLTCTLPSWSGVRDDRLPDLAEYLRKTGLPALYETELRTLCIEDGDLDACLALGALLGGRDLRKRALALLDSITWTDERWMLSTELVRADLAYRAGEYQEALEVLEAVIEELPAKDIMVEAVLLRAECQYRVGLADDAIMNLRSISPYVPGNRHAELALYLGLCEEEVGDLTEAERLVGEAEADGSSDAPLHLLRLKLKRGDLESFLVIADEIAAMRTGRAAREVCDLARDMAVVLPRAWHALIDPLVADTSFTATGCPEIASSIVQLAEAGEDMKGTCERLLARSNSREAAERLRYARAFSAADAALCDTLAALSRSVSVPGLRNRCLATCLASAAGDEGGALVAGLVPYLERMWDDLGASDRMELARLLAGFDKGQISRGYLMEIREGLEVGHDDMAILEVASAMVTAGDTSRALSEYRGLSKSPLPSEHTLEAERSAYRFEARIPAEEDIAGMVERIARQGLDPLELGDLLMEQLKDFERAAGVYRRVLAEPPEGTPVEEVKIKLAGALAMLALETNGQGLRAEALDLLSEVADTNIVAAGDIIEVLKVSTDWLRHERTRAFAIIQDVGRRDDLTSGELYEMAMLLYHLFSHRDGNVYAQCAVTLRRLSKEFPTSPEAPLGGFLAARLKFMAGARSLPGLPGGMAKPCRYLTLRRRDG
jgi:tetratricopeptide (TPR) repeat protein